MKNLKDSATCMYTEADGVLVGLYTDPEHNVPVKVNLSFLKTVIHPTFDKNGQIGANEVGPVRIASMDLSVAVAKQLKEGLKDFLEEE